ncbi:hypothetical protein [Fodinicola acaciae]|uniref:hypothetical protein n=1 Tax=Fodinicola acaciae TaxID=2681555 RepID=UPI0013D2F1CC|nr:hypothetical protein [Fodinicola acaciae]
MTSSAESPRQHTATTGKPAASWRSDILHMQRHAGNAATTLAIQRATGTATATIAQVDELIDRFNTPEEELIELLGKLSDPDKHTIVVGYRDRLAGVFNFAEMRRAVDKLGAELPVKLDWLQKAAFMTSGINYSEIKKAVTDAPQAQRDMLKNARWKSFFLSVCSNETIIEAVADLHFDLPTQLTWVRGEASALMSLTLAKLRKLLTDASAGDRAIVGGDAWRSFWTDVCTNETMAELVDILFPDNLTRKLEWMADEGASLAQVEAKVAATTDAAQKVAVFASVPVRTMACSLCNNDQLAQLVLNLGGEWAQWRGWMIAKGAPLIPLARAVVARNAVTDPVIRGFLNAAATSAVATRDYLRRLADAQLVSVRAYAGANDLVTELNNDEVRRALAGEIARADQSPHITETLQAGPTTSPFVAMNFNLDSRYTMSYWRDRVEVDVGIALTPASGDARAAELLPSAIATWRSNILGAWDNQFQMQNGQRTIPLRFHANLGNSGPNPVTVHSGAWVWPNLNATNWFVPDPVNQPGQATAVATAPIHEFGHLIGNADEYNLNAAHYLTTVGSPAASDPNAVPSTDSAGTTRYTNVNSVMGSGGPALKRHVMNILAAVNSNLRPGEPAFSWV